MLVNHAQLDNHLSMVLANYQDQLVIASNNTTLLPTYVTNAHQTKSQTTVLVEDKILLANHTVKVAMPMVKFNSDNNNASDAKHAQLDKTWLETLAKYQDQHVIATNNIMLKLTNVIDAQLDNFQTMVLTEDKILDAQPSHQLAMLIINSKDHKNNATLAQLVQLPTHKDS
jgi:hypothetical protein